MINGIKLTIIMIVALFATLAMGMPVTPKEQAEYLRLRHMKNGLLKKVNDIDDRLNVLQRTAKPSVAPRAY